MTLPTRNLGTGQEQLFAENISQFGLWVNNDGLVDAIHK
jgi:hypothetical protein